MHPILARASSFQSLSPTSRFYAITPPVISQMNKFSKSDRVLCIIFNMQPKVAKQGNQTTLLNHLLQKMDNFVWISAVARMSHDNTPGDPSMQLEENMILLKLDLTVR